jgi:fatty acid desaturase
MLIRYTRFGFPPFPLSSLPLYLLLSFLPFYTYLLPAHLDPDRIRVDRRLRDQVFMVRSWLCAHCCSHFVHAD